MILAQLTLDRAAAVRHAATAGLSPMALQDETAVLKTLLTEAFSGPAVRPWRVERVKGTVMTMLGYSTLEGPDLQGRLALALPSAAAAVRDLYWTTVALPAAGAIVAFQVRLCPVVHVTCGREGIRGGHRDAFLAAIDRARAEGHTERLERQKVYRDYLATQLKGAELLAFSLDGLRIPRLMRKDRQAPSGFDGRAMPLANLSGLIRVLDPAELGACLARGIGRQRAFGAGFVRLLPGRITAEPG